MPRLQSACRSHHSTETALLHILSDFLDAVDGRRVILLGLLDLGAARRVVLLGLLDLSAAFDMATTTLCCVNFSGNSNSMGLCSFPF